MKMSAQNTIQTPYTSGHGEYNSSHSLTTECVYPLEQYQGSISWFAFLPLLV